MESYEYISRLHEGLKNYPQKFVKETITVYRSLIRERTEAGMSMDEIIDELGSPHEVLEHIRMTNGPLKGDSFEEKAGQIIDRIDPVLDSFTDFLFNAAHQTKKRMNIVKSDMVPYQRLFDKGQFTSVSVTATSDCKVIIECAENAEICFRPSGGKEKNGIFHSEINSEYQIRLYEEGTLYLRLPQRLHKLSVKTDNGDIQVHMLSVENCVLETRYGDITIDTLQTNILDLTCAASNVSIENAVCDHSRLNVQYREIIFKDFRCKSLDVSSVDSEIKGDFSADTASVHTESGKINLTVRNHLCDLLISTKDSDITAVLPHHDFSIYWHTEGKLDDSLYEGTVVYSPETSDMPSGAGTARLISGKGNIQVK